MPTNLSPPPNGELQRSTKGSGKNKWKDKLSSGEGWRKGGNAESDANEVDTFLNGSGPRSTKEPEKVVSDRFVWPNSTTAVTRPQKDNDIDRFLHHNPSPAQAEARPSLGTSLVVPPLDMTKRQGSLLAPQESDLGPIKDMYRRPKPRMNKGLRVNFASTAPEVIGEGGDEAELPSREISKSHPTLAVSDTAQPMPLRRRSTGYSVPGKSDLPAVQSQYVHVQDVDSKELLLANSRDQIHNLEAPQAGRDNVHESAAALTSKPLPMGPFSDPADIHKKSVAQQSLRPEAFEAPFAESAVHLTNSLTPVPSPLPLKWADKAPSHYGFPNVSEKTTRSTRSPERSDKGRERPPEKGRSGSAPEIKPFSIRSVAKALGHDALDEFDIRVRGLFNLFRMGVSAHEKLMDLPFSRWIRIAAWWFLKGRLELESAVRNRPKSPEKSNVAPEIYTPRSLMQAYVDLAKAWWIIDDVTPNHPEVKKYGNASMSSLGAIIENIGDRSLAGLVEFNVAMIANMRALTMSMKRNNRLPPEPFEIQGLDSQVLLKFPALSPSTTSLLTSPTLDPGNNTSFFPFLIGDTPVHFSLGRMFSRLSLNPRHSIKAEAQMPSLISIIQNRSDGDFGAFIATQDGQVNISIRSDKSERSDFTWRLIHWNNATHTMGLPLSHGLDLALELSEKDYKTLWDMCDHSRKTQQKFVAQADESLIYECKLHHFERLEMPNEPGGFPQGSIQDCQLRLFSKNLHSTNGTGKKILHGGFRLAVLTGSTVKSPRVLHCELSGDKLILFGPWRREDGPCLTVRMPGSPTLLLAFNKQEELDTFRLLASGMAITNQDRAFPPLPLRGFNVETHPLKKEDPSGHGANSVAELRWRQLQVVDKRRVDPKQPADSSDGLRLLTDCDLGSFIDRLSTSTGELKISLGVEDFNTVRLLRPAQPDITWSLEDRLHKDVVQSLSRTLQGMARSASIRTYEFCSLTDVHTFQAAVTGFTVRFDGHASSFSISRRRMVVPLQKKWAATTARLQLLQQDSHVIQLAVFFKDFDHGTCMNFVLKGMDVFETSTRSGTFFLRIADAKFALPKSPEDPERDFLCLDVLDYPGEHDDITIGFDNEEGMLSSSASFILWTN